VRTIQTLFEEIQTHHKPNAPASIEEITRWEEASGYVLPTDLKEFYQLTNGASLFKEPPGLYGDAQVYQYYIDRVEHIGRVRVDLLGEEGDDDQYAPASWYGVCDIEADYVAIDLATVKGSFCLVIDCWHESFGWTGDSKIIAQSFTEFLDQLLQSKGDQYWLDSDFKHYGYFNYDPDAAS
jgi:cell wall assembly regulator SMI1